MSGLDSADNPETTPDGASPEPVGDAVTKPIEVVTFLDDASVPCAETPEAAVVDRPIEPARPPGPGLPEACGWTTLVLVGQFFATIVMFIVVFVGLIAANGGQMPRKPPNLTDLSPNLFALVSGVPGFLAYLILIPLACWRISPAPLRKLNFSRPSITQTLIVCSCVLPLGFVSDALYELNKPLWERFLELIHLEGLKEMALSETMAQLNGASLPILLFFISVVPAIGEEWMLRGLIGRGLVARWGVIPGIALTSMLFAAMHIDPPHVAAVFPIGIVMHCIYLMTRSFWMPILFHFLNNATVSVFTSLGAIDSQEAAADEAGPWWVTWGLAILAVPYLAVALSVLWRMRTRYQGADGREPHKEYFTVEHLPETEARRTTPNHAVAAAVFGLLFGAQVVFLGLELWSEIKGDVDQAVPVEELEPHPAAVTVLRFPR